MPSFFHPVQVLGIALPFPRILLFGHWPSLPATVISQAAHDRWLAGGRFRPTRHKGVRRERINCFALLVIKRPLNQSSSLRLCPRTGQADDFALDMEDIVRSDRQHPTKAVNAKTNQGMRAKRASFHTKAHCDGGRVPSRCCQAFENCFSGSFVVQMEWLRIELGSDLLDIIFRDLDFLTLETHPQRQIFEPFDHYPFAFLILSLSPRHLSFVTLIIIEVRNGGVRSLVMRGLDPRIHHFERWIAGASPAM